MNYLYDKLEAIRKMPAAYLGKASIIRLQGFIGGYLDALNEFKVEIEPKNLFPLPFWYFHEYVANHYNYFESTAGWCNIILQENKGDKEKSFVEFFKLFDEFIALNAISCDKVILNEKNIEFHYTDEYVPRLISAEYPDETEPLYKNPIAIYLIELTCNSGYLCLINTDNKSILEQRIYRNKQDAKQYIEKCFGKMLRWEKVQIENIELNKIE